MAVSYDGPSILRPIFERCGIASFNRTTKLLLRNYADLEADELEVLGSLNELKIGGKHHVGMIEELLDHGWIESDGKKGFKTDFLLTRSVR